MATFELGSTFLNDPATKLPRHLWILASDPSVDPGCIVLVNVSSDPGRHDDRTCILRRGDHPVIQHESYVRYDCAEFGVLAAIQKAHAKLLITQRVAVSAAVLSRIHRGFEKSPHAKKKFLLKLLEQKFINVPM